jgi:hypothetical protein
VRGCDWEDHGPGKLRQKKKVETSIAMGKAGQKGQCTEFNSTGKKKKITGKNGQLYQATKTTESSP